MHRLAAEAPSFIDSFVQFVPAILALLGVLVMSVFGAWNRKRGNHENRAPDVNEIWLRQAADAKLLDEERRFRRVLEDLGGMWRRSFRGYVDRVQNGGSHVMTEYERRAYDTPFPTTDNVRTWPTDTGRPPLGDIEDTQPTQPGGK